LVWSIFSDDPEIRIKLDLFFEYFKQLPYWYQAIFIGVVSVLSMVLKGADIMSKEIMSKGIMTASVSQYSKKTSLLSQQTGKNGKSKVQYIVPTTRKNSKKNKYR
jgi:hypothetical protein